MTNREPGRIRTFDSSGKRIAKRSQTAAEIRAKLAAKGIDPDHPFRGMTADPTETTSKLTPSLGKAVAKQSRQRQIGSSYQEALQEAAGEQGPGMPKIYSFNSIARTAAASMHNSSEHQGQWNLDTWWDWIHAGQNTGLLTMDDDEVEQMWLVDPKGYNLIWDWIHQYEASTGITLEPNYTINLRGGLQRGPITGSRLHEAQEKFEDPSIGYGTEHLDPDKYWGRDAKGRPFADRPITIDPNSPRYRNR